MRRVLERLSSLALTAPAILALAIAVFASYQYADMSAWWVIGVLALLALNLLCAIIVNRAFRVRYGLLVFHVGLLLVTVLVGLSQLFGYSARIEMAQGQRFDVASMEVLRRGPWSSLDRIGRIQMRQESFAVDYRPGMVRGQTSARVSVDGPSVHGSVLFGDTRALDLDDHRFYSTSNKGFAAELRWVGADGQRVRGAAHFPSYPLNDWRQLNDWQSPSGERLKFELVFDRLAPTETAWTFDDNALSWVRGLRVHSDALAPLLLVPGESVAVAAGRLYFERPALWMGYRIVHQPFLSLILASGLVSVVGLGWHVLAATPVRLPASRVASRVASRAAAPGVRHV